MKDSEAAGDRRFRASAAAALALHAMCSLSACAIAAGWQRSRPEASPAPRGPRALVDRCTFRWRR